MTPPARDPEDVLREAFEARAARVRVATDALSTIRARVGHATRRRRTMTMGLTSLATGAAATVAVLLMSLSSCLPPQTGLPAVSGGSADSGTPAATPSSTETGTAPGTPSGTGPAPAGVDVRLPVYFTGDVGGRIVLYREFHPATVPADTLPDRMRGAVSMMLAGRATDPDYDSRWPAGAGVRGVRIDGDIVATVDVSGAGTNNAVAEVGTLAVQQLVWTVTAVAADTGAQLRGVRLLFDGQQLGEVWGQVNVGGVLTRASALETLAPVWLISPQHADTLGRTFDVHLAGAVPEATVQLWVRDGAGTLVQRHTVTLDAGGPARGEAHTPVTLAPGHYTLEAFYSSLVDGSVQSLDDHEITVR